MQENSIDPHRIMKSQPRKYMEPLQFKESLKDYPGNLYAYREEIPLYPKQIRSKRDLEKDVQQR